MNEDVSGAVVLVLVLTATSLPVVAQSGGLDLSAPAVQAEPGGQANVTFEVTNHADTPSAAIVNVTDRPDWSVAARQDAGGLWQESGKWLFQTVEPGATATPVLVFSVPESASGEYTVVATVTDGERSERVETTIGVVRSGEADSRESDDQSLVGLLRENLLVLAGLVAGILVLFVVALRL